MIEASEYTDPLLQSIRNMVSQKDDGIPFLLMPVKLETRFMKAERPIDDDKDSYPWVVEGLFELEEKIDFNPLRIPPHEALGKTRNVKQQLEAFSGQLEGIIRLSAEEKSNLNWRIQDLKESYQTLSRNLSRVKWDESKAREIQTLKSSISGGLQTIEGKTKALQITGASEYRESDEFIGLLQGINQHLSAIKDKELTTKDRKKKRIVFAYLDQQYQQIDSALKKGRQSIHINMQATQVHLQEIDNIQAELPALKKAVEKNLTRIDSEYKKAEYKQKFNHLFNKISILSEEVEQRLKPKVQLKLDLQTSKARNILWQVNDIRKKLKRQNKSPFRSYDEVRNSRTALYEELHELRADIHKVVEGTAREREAISKAWDDVDAELEKFTHRVDAFDSEDRYEKAGLTRTITHINEEYRKDLAGLKSGAKSYFTELNNNALEKSALTYRDSLAELKSLDSEIEANLQNTNPDALQSTLNKLVAFKNKFSGTSRDIQVLPLKDYNELNALTSKLETNIDRVTTSTNLDDQFKNVVLESARDLKLNAESQFTDAIDRKDRFYDELRNPYVFAQQTRTVDELWVRIYPDDIAIHTHEEALTEPEVEAAKAYWYEIWAAKDDYEAKLAAWRAISTGFGPQRAAWIVKVMKPSPKKVSPFLERFDLRSENLKTINSHLSEILTILDSERVDPIGAMGRAYPLLQEVEKQLQASEKEHEQLIRKTEKLVIKLQSQISVIINKVREDRTETRMAVVNQFVYSFNRIARTLAAVKRIPAKDIFRDAEGPGIFPQPQIKDSNWTETPHSKVMPDRFVVITKRNGEYKHIKVGEKLPESLTVGLNPGNFQNSGFEYDEDGNLIVEEGIKWLTDFEEARKKGMALAIELDEEDLEKGFEQVLVIGIKDTNKEAGKALVEKLIDNHHYLPEGASFLPVGTVTNNSDGKSSAYKSFEEDAALSFKVERNDEAPLTPGDPDYPTDAIRLAHGLGISADYLDNLDHHSNTSISDALNMNRALFHGTLGNYMEEALDRLFTLDNIDRTRAFMSNYVARRGYLPSIRIGTQPYGILPTTAHSKFQVTADDTNIPQLNKEDFENTNTIESELQTRYDIRLRKLLRFMNNLWKQFRNEHVPTSENVADKDPQQHFMQMLGLQANSSEIYYRYGLNVASRQSAEEFGEFDLNFSDEQWSPSSVATYFREAVLEGYFYKSDNFNDEQKEYSNTIEYLLLKYNRVTEQFNKARIFVNRFIEDQAEIVGDQVDTRELLEEWAAASAVSGTAEERLEAMGELQNYIDWITSENPWDLHAQNTFAEVQGNSLTAGMPSKSLLFLLLRHSMLSAYADTILKILEFEGLVDQKTRKKMGQPAHFYSQFAGDFNYITKWSYLFSPIDRLNGPLGNDMNESNAFYIYMNSRSGASRYLNRYISPESPQVFNGYSLKHNHQPFMDELDTTRKAIEKIKDLPTAEADQLMKEHLDLCSYRLDAWQLGIVNKRLEKQRSTQGSGLYIGAFGWVENLEKGGDRVIAPNLPAGLWKNGDDPVYTDEDNLGFIHTPSLNHAITAAILRAGYHANESKAEVNNQMAVNLSSGRVRKALTLLNGILQGQDAAAILGYQFERSLHENYLHLGLELDQYIYDFRKVFPLQVPVETGVPLEEIVYNNVVNGIELLEDAQQFIENTGGASDPGDSIYQTLKSRENAWWNHVGEGNITSASAAKRDAMLKEIDRMADTFDAFGDLCISESVYQIAQGNHVRASAIMDKLAKGDVPNEIRITETPRTGTVLTQKLGMFITPVRGIDHALSGTNTTPLSGVDLDNAITAASARATGWDASFSPRALTEPTLNKWAGELIGDPNQLKCLVSYAFGDAAETLTTVTLADLAVQPLDVLHLFGTGPLDGGAELNARIAMYIKDTVALPVDFDGTVDDLQIRIQYTKRDNSWSDDDHSFYEKAAFIQGIRKFLTDSAVMSADTLLISGQEEVEANAVRNQDVVEYLTRITNLQARIQSLKEDWEFFFDNVVSYDNAAEHTFTDQQIDDMRELLLKASTFGIPGALPESMARYGDVVGRELIGSGDGVYKAVASRLKQAAKEMAVAEDTAQPHDNRIIAITNAAKELLGKSFVMIPHFHLRRSTEVADQLNLAPDKGLMRAAGELPYDGWMQGVSQVRERVASLGNLEMWADNFDLDLPEKSVIQFPFALNEGGESIDHWLGIPFPDGYTPEEDKMAMVISHAQALVQDIGGPKMGLLIDEWVEIIPNKDETTGIAFNYDQPDAKPPNNLLLAVTPKETGKWDWDDLVYTLEDTLELAKNRAVEPEHLEDSLLGQILPGILTEIVPPQLRPDDDNDNPQDNPLGLQVVTDFGVVNETFEPEED